MELGLQLADVPVFIFGKNALATGIGEKLNEINLKPAWYVVIHPGVHVPTAEIFKKFAGRVLTEEGRISIMRILETTQQRRNALQQVVSELYPAVNEVLNIEKIWFAADDWFRSMCVSGVPVEGRSR
jgi:4-diphosphocytidyl-2-C-methyl-D-erythritol kinase